MLARRIEIPEMEGLGELWLGEVEFDAGQLQAASEHFARSLMVCRDGADKRGEANALWRLGAADLARGDSAAARGRLGEALRAFHSTEMWKEILGCLEDFAALAQVMGRHEEAVRIAAAATLTRQRLGLVRRPAAQLRWQDWLEKLRQPLGDDRFVAAWNVAWDQWETDDALTCALALPLATEASAAK